MAESTESTQELQVGNLLESLVWRLANTATCENAMADSSATKRNEPCHPLNHQSILSKIKEVHTHET